jgi:mono/diheme cytochrome c family protein
MTRKLAGVLAATAVAICVAVVVRADLKKGSYQPSALGSLSQPEPQAWTPDSTFSVAAYPAPALELAPGEGRQEVETYCNTCHTPRYITMQPPLPATTWEAEVNKMNKTFGAAIPDAESQKIIRYLQAHYTPETRK